jgi:hypothetical protein
MNEQSLTYKKKGIKQWFIPSPIKKLAHAETASRRRPLQQVTTGNSHAPCAIIGERMAEILKGLSRC